MLGTKPSERRTMPKRQPTGLTLDAILARACRILDEEGAQALTFRRLAADLGVGVSSLYWYVDDKDDLLALCYHAVADDPTEALLARPIDLAGWQDGVRALCLGLFELVEAHPWIAPMLNDAWHLDRVLIRVWDRIGQTLTELGLDADTAFSATTVLLNHVGAMGAMAQRSAHEEPGGTGERQQSLIDLADAMSELDPAQFPFTTAIAPVFCTHTERDQFLGGLDLILGGIATGETKRPRRAGIFSGGEQIAEQVDDYLVGFGE